MDAVVHAPEIDRPGLAWFNAPTPLALRSLRGKLVILDFWTYCCINCMHVLPALRRLEESFPEELVVIGIHSPKFSAERDAENLKRAIARYDIRHPVVNDPGMTLWRQYGVRAWPTLVFISPEGRILGHAPGEPDPERLLAAVGQALAEQRAAGTLSPSALPLAPPEAPAGRFAFPGKIKPLKAPADGARWALADAGHHQIVLLDDGGAEIKRLGSGRPGLADGVAARAAFNGPQGLVCGTDAIYVADTGNHAIRRIDLESGEVATLAGNGRRGPVLGAATPGPDQALASVWDLELAGERLCFANAGTHQLGQYDLERATVRALAGTGGEDIVDGPADQALLAQPSGLALSPDGRQLAFADSETSSVRVLALDGAGEVRTVVGAGLFDFGHVNGALAQARLQHALGLAWLDPSRLIVADSYNNALRLIDLAAGQIGDFDDGSYLCTDPVCLPLGEPAGVWAEGRDRVLLADTNNHRVLEYRGAEKRYRTWAS
ncbi:MAG TPA: thioredoxin-like domain-containing protein [Alphaproteobacteria bacterium]|nr:thioredoxin-like domain-containing protein [Alphaproteobacteria bacterium]